MEVARSRGWSLTAAVVAAVLVVQTCSHFALGDIRTGLSTSPLAIAVTVLALWYLRTPLARLNTEGIIAFTSPVLRPRLVAWDAVDHIVRNEGQVHVFLSGAPPLAFQLNEIAASDREPFWSELQSMVSTR